MTIKMISLYVMAILYILAGLNHFRSPKFYKPMMPPWIPLHDFLISLSGITEVALGAMLLLQRTQVFAAWSIVAMLIAFLPVHIYMYQARKTVFQEIPTLIILARLPLQVALMGWAYIYI